MFVKERHLGENLEIHKQKIMHLLQVEWNGLHVAAAHVRLRISASDGAKGIILVIMFSGSDICLYGLVEFL